MTCPHKWKYLEGIYGTFNHKTKKDTQFMYRQCVLCLEIQSTELKWKKPTKEAMKGFHRWPYNERDHVTSEEIDRVYKDLMREKRCLKCGKKLKLVKGETHVYYCPCTPGVRIGIG